MNSRFRGIVSLALVFASSGAWGGSFSSLNLSDWRWGGSLSLNYRNIGADHQEIDIENDLLLSDIFFRVEGPVLEDTPFLLEFSLDGDGKPQLYRLAVKSFKVRRVELEFGRFLVPFGQHNELYSPDLYPLVTKPLLYANPGLDFVSRVSYPHPLISSGYTDTGALLSYKPHAEPVWFPKEITVYVVNGLQESPIHGRRPPDSRNFLILDSVNGTDVDWGHEVTFLSDNNDTKNPGGRISWDYGDAAYPSPFSRAALINGFSLGVSGIVGKYDIEDRLSNSVWESELGLRRGKYRLSAEYMSGQVQAKFPTVGTANAVPPLLIKDRYFEDGISVQMEAPFPDFPLSRTSHMVFRGETLRRVGPPLNVLGEITPGVPRAVTRANKYSGGINSRLSPYFIVKAEYSLWTFDLYNSIYQVLWAGVLTF